MHRDKPASPLAPSSVPQCYSGIRVGDLEIRGYNLQYRYRQASERKKAGVKDVELRKGIVETGEGWIRVNCEGMS